MENNVNLTKAAISLCNCYFVHNEKVQEGWLGLFPQKWNKICLLTQSSLCNLTTYVGVSSQSHIWTRKSNSVNKNICVVSLILGVLVMTKQHCEYKILRQNVLGGS